MSDTSNNISSLSGFDKIVSLLGDKNIEATKDELYSLFEDEVLEEGSSIVDVSLFATKVASFYGIDESEILKELEEFSLSDREEGISINDVYISDLENSVLLLRESLESIKESQGIVARGWDWVKNTLNFGASSDKTLGLIEDLERSIEKLKQGEKVDIDELYEKLNEADTSLNKYQQGQKQSVNTLSTALSTVAVIGLGALLAPVTGGMSLGLGLALVAAGTGAYMVPQIMDGVTTKDAVSGDVVGTKYFKDIEFVKDLGTGVVNSAVSVIGMGAGSAIRGVAQTGAKTIVGEKALQVLGEKGLNILAHETTSVIIGDGIAIGDYFVETGTEALFNDEVSFSDLYGDGSDLKNILITSTTASIAAGTTSYLTGMLRPFLTSGDTAFSQVMGRFLSSGITGGAAGGAASFSAGGVNYLIQINSYNEKLREYAKEQGLSEEELSEYIAHRNFDDFIKASGENVIQGVITGVGMSLGFEAVQLATGTPAPLGTKRVEKGVTEEGLEYRDYIDKEGRVIARDIKASDIRNMGSAGLDKNTSIALREDSLNLIGDGAQNDNILPDSTRTIRFTFDYQNVELNQGNTTYDIEAIRTQGYGINWADRAVYLGQAKPYFNINQTINNQDYMEVSELKEGNTQALRESTQGSIQGNSSQDIEVVGVKPEIFMQSVSMGNNQNGSFEGMEGGIISGSTSGNSNIPPDKTISYLGSLENSQSAKAQPTQQEIEDRISHLEKTTFMGSDRELIQIAQTFSKEEFERSLAILGDVSFVNRYNIRTSQELKDYINLDQRALGRLDEIESIVRYTNLSNINTMANLDEEPYQRTVQLIKKGLDIKEALEHNQDDTTLRRIEELTKDMDIFYARRYLYLDEAQYQKVLEMNGWKFDVSRIDEGLGYSEDRYENIRYLAQNDALSYSNYKELSSLEIEQIDEILNFKQERGLNINQAYRIHNLDEERYEEALAIFDEGVNAAYVDLYAGFSDIQFENYNILKSAGISRESSIIYANKTSMTQKVCQRMADMMKDGVDEDNALVIALLDDTQFERYQEYRNKGSDILNSIRYARLSEVQYQRFNTLLSETGDMEKSYTIATFSEEKYQKYLDIIETYGFDEKDAMVLVNCTDVAHAAYLKQRGIDTYLSMKYANYYKGESWDRFLSLLYEGADVETATNSALDDITYSYTLRELQQKNSPMRDFMHSDDYETKLKKASQGKYQSDIINMLSQDTININTRNLLINSNIGEEDFLSAIKTLSTSTYKLAMNTPNQYLSGIDIEYTTKVQGKYPELSSEVLAQQQAQVTKFFEDNLYKMIRALKYIDKDTLNQMMDKRTDKFQESLDNLNELTDENYELLSKLISCKNSQTQKPMTARDKIELAQIVEIYQKTKLDMSALLDMTSSGEIDVSAIKQTIENEIMARAGVSKEDLDNIPPENRKSLNQDYAYLLLGESDDDTNGLFGFMQDENYIDTVKEQLSAMREMSKKDMDELVKQMEDTLFEHSELVPMMTLEMREMMIELIDMYKNLDKYSDEEIIDISTRIAQAATSLSKNDEAVNAVIREGVLGNFQDFIQDTNNIYGKTNEKTKAIFKEYGLDYEKWLSPEIEDKGVVVQGKRLNITLWDREPTEDIFMGNKTSCCTAIGAGNQGSTPAYLLNTSFNVVEVYDEENNVIGMSRVYMGKIDGQNALLMDNIELNSTFIKGMSDDELTSIRNAIFNYMNSYAKQVAGDDTPVYFATEFSHVPTQDLSKISAKTEFTGEVSQELVYINEKCTWIDPSKMGDMAPMEWYQVPKETTINPYTSTQDEIISYLESLEDNQSAKDILRAASKMDDTPKKLERLRAALDLLEGGKTDDIIRQIAKDTLSALSENQDTLSILTNIAQGLGLEFSDVITNEDGSLLLKTNMGNMSARLKSEDSLYSKLRKRIYSLSIDIPKNLTDTLKTAKDTQGTRFVIGDISWDRENLGIEDYLRENNIDFSDEDMDRFCSFMTNSDDFLFKSRDEMQLFGELETIVAENLAQIQSQKFTDNFCELIRSGQIKLLRFDNYGGMWGLRYISDAQAEEIRDAYQDWFDMEFEKAKEGNSQYQIKYIDEEAYLYDPVTDNKFYKSMIALEAKNRENGYTASQFTLIDSDNRVFELQYRGTQMDYVAQIEHIIYDLKQGKDTVQGEEYKEIRDIINKIIKASSIDYRYMSSFNSYYSNVFHEYRLKELGIDTPSYDRADISGYPRLKWLLSEEELQKISIENMLEFCRKLEEGAK